MGAAVEQVVQTATSVVRHELTAREAVTILATLTRDALPDARALRAADAGRAEIYRELIVALGRELRRTEAASGEARYVRAVTDDLARVVHALE